MKPSIIGRAVRLAAAVTLAIFAAQTAHAAPPANDNFASAQLVSGASGSVTGTNVEATKQAGEPDHAGDPGGQSVWFRWTAPSSGPFQFNTVGSDFDTTIGIYTGATLVTLTEVASNDEAIEGLVSRVYFQATAGTVYRIAVDGYEGGNGFAEEGSITLGWAAVPAPANNAFASATVIAGGSGGEDVNIAGATKEAGEPDHFGSPGGSSVWYSWTAPSDGQVSFSLPYTEFIPLIGVYTGNTLATLTEEKSGDFEAQFTATAGTTYRIAIDTDGGIGEATLVWNLLAVHDNFENAVVITGASGSRTDNNDGATRQTGEPDHGAGFGSTMWYRWTAPANGLVSMIPRQSSGDGMIVAVYTGTTLTGLTRVENRDPFISYSMIFEATAGVEYRIAVDSSDSGTPGTYTFEWLQAGPPANDNVANATALTGTSGTTQCLLLGSTFEFGEGVYASGTGSVFYRWTAPAAGVFRMKLASGQNPSSFDISQVEGTGPNPLGLVRAGGLAGVTAGQVITFRVEGNDFDNPRLNLEYNFIAGASVITADYEGFVMLERTGQTKTITLRRTVGDFSGTATVTLAPQSGTGLANEVTHYTLSQTAITFAPNETEKQVTVTTVNNAVTEGELQIRALLQAGSNAVVDDLDGVYLSRFDDEDDPANNLIANATLITGASGTIAGTTVGADPDFDTDPGYLDIGEDPGPLFGAPIETVWYRWTSPFSGPVAFRVSSAPAFFGEARVAVFEGTTPAATVVSQGLDGAGWIAETGRTYHIGIAAAEQDGFGVISGMPFSLSWAPPAAGFISIDDVTVIEGPGTNAVLTITRTNGSIAFTLDVNTFESAGATEGEDFTGTSTTVSFAAGEMSKTVSIPILDDAIVEYPESGGSGQSFSVAISTVDPEVFIARGTAKVTILDDEAGSIVSIDPLGNDNETKLEDAGPFQIRLTRAGITAGVSTVDYTLTAGTATAADVTLTGGTVTFAAGETEATITIPITDDTLDEPLETLTLTILNPGAGTTLGEKTSAVLTIVDDDIPGVLAFASATATATEPANSILLTVSRTDGSDGEVSATFTIAPGTATAGADYTTTSGTVTFLDGETSKDIVVALNDDFLDEPNETLTVTLRAPTAGASLGAQRTTTVTLVDNDIPGEFAFSTTASTISESTGSLILTVVRNLGSDGTVSVSYGTINGTAVAGVHFGATSGTLNFAHGETSRTITVPILENSYDEPSRTFSLALSNATSGATIGTQGTTSVTITDNDTFAAKKTAFAALLRKAGIAKGSISAKTTATGKITAQALVDSFKFTFTGTLGVDGTATMTFAQRGRSTKTLTLQIGGDAFRGTLNDGDGNIYTFDGSENDTGTKTAPVDSAAKYTALIQTRPAPNSGLSAGRFPQGEGWVQFAVGFDGKITGTGKLADGTALSFGGVVDVSGKFPVFIQLYAGKTGSIAFTLVFDSTQTETDATAFDVRWAKPALPKDKLYPLGWPGAINADLFASKFIAPAKPTTKNPNPPYVLGTHNVLGLAAPTNVVFTITGGATPGFGNNATIDAKNKVTVTGPAAGATGATTLTVTLKPTGAMSGAFTQTTTLTNGKFSGVVLQKTHNGGGYFIGVNATSGRVSIDPRP